MLDLLVIGAGLAGLQAAVSAAQAGARVRLIAKGLSATHWAAGTVDVLGYAPPTEGAAPELVQRPLDSIAALPADHPYGMLGREGVASALETFTALTRELGVPYEGSANGDNLLLPSPVGAPRPAFLAPRGQRGGDLSRPEPMLMVGFQGMRDFYPELIATNLSKQGFAARAAFLPLSLLTTQHDRNTVQLAYGMDDSLVTARLGKELKRLVKPGERIGLPAILGVVNHQRVLDDLRTQTGAAVFEIPTLPPSVPGFRLHAALRKHVEALGVRVEIAHGGHRHLSAQGDEISGWKLPRARSSTCGQVPAGDRRHFGRGLQQRSPGSGVGSDLQSALDRAAAAPSVVPVPVHGSAGTPGVPRRRGGEWRLAAAPG